MSGSEPKDWNGNTIHLGSWVLYVQHEIIRIGRVIGHSPIGGRVEVEWHKSQWGGVPGKPGKVNPHNLTVMGFPSDYVPS